MPRTVGCVAGFSIYRYVPLSPVILPVAGEHEVVDRIDVRVDVGIVVTGRANGLYLIEARRAVEQFEARAVVGRKRDPVGIGGQFVVARGIPELGHIAPACGLSFHGGYAIIGMSKPRREHAFWDLPLQKNLDEKGALPRCGLQVIELATGTVAHWLRIEGRIEELFDVAVLPGVIRPKAMSFATPAIGHHFCYAQDNRVEHWSPMAPPSR